MLASTAVMSVQSSFVQHLCWPWWNVRGSTNWLWWNVRGSTSHNNLLIYTYAVARGFKGDLTHTVSPNLMLILSTYRVVLHPSYLQKVFSFIIFIKERYRFTILWKNPSSWRRAVWVELKSDEHLRRSPTKQRHLMPFHLSSAVLNHDQDLL